MFPGWTIGIKGGVTFSLVSEKATNIYGNEMYNIGPSGIFGGFIGYVVEKNFKNSDFSIFFESQYNYIIGKVLYINSLTPLYDGNYGGLGLNVGLRFHFKVYRF